MRRRRGTIPLAAVAACAALAATTFTSDRTGGQAPSQGPRQGAAARRGANGLTAFIDPDTGQLREPTAEELAALANSQLDATRSAPTNATTPIVAPSGIQGLTLGDEQMTFTVVTRAPDGTLAIEHAAGKTAAERRVRDIAASGGTVAGKEPLRDR